MQWGGIWYINETQCCMMREVAKCRTRLIRRWYGANVKLVCEILKMASRNLPYG